MTSEIQTVLREQQKYYDDRAPEYDDWWYRRNGFDEGPEANALWRAEEAMVDAELDAAGLTGDVLELAAGTGIWSAKFLRNARSLTIVDGSAQMLERNAVAGNPRVMSIQADVFDWRSQSPFDGAGFAFWISHVPRALFQSFFQSVTDHLRPGGKFFFVDNCPKPEASAPHVVGLRGELMTRRLANGNTSTIVKNYYSQDEIVTACRQAGLSVEVFETPSLFQYGIGQRSK